MGHAGASAYQAVMALFGVAPATMKATALALNIVVASVGAYKFYRAGFFSWRVFYPFALGSIPFAFIGGQITLSDWFYKVIVGAVLLFAAYRMFAVSVVKGSGGAPVANLDRGGVRNRDRAAVRSHRSRRRNLFESIVDPHALVRGEDDGWSFSHIHLGEFYCRAGGQSFAGQCAAADHSIMDDRCVDRRRDRCRLWQQTFWQRDAETGVGVCAGSGRVGVDVGWSQVDR